MKSSFNEEGFVPINERPTREQKSRHATSQRTLVININLLAAESTFSRTQEDFEEWKSPMIRGCIETLYKRPARRRKSKHAVERDIIDAATGFTGGKKDNDAAHRMSWTQEVEQLTQTREEDKR